MNVIKQLSENQVILVLVPSMQYNDTILEVTKSLSKKKVCYVTLNKTFDSLKEIFKKNNVTMDNVIFIDAISKTFKKTPDQTKDCYYVSSPGALTELSIQISKVLKHGFDYFIFDSLTNLLIYEKKDSVAKFVSSIINIARENKAKSVFFALSAKEQQLLIKETSMFVDKVIDISGNKK